AVTEPFEEGLRKERELFERSRSAPVSIARRHLFFAERDARRTVRRESPLPTTVVVIGLGAMGRQIAAAFAAAGVEVLAYDATASVANDARDWWRRQAARSSGTSPHPEPALVGRWEELS